MVRFLSQCAKYIMGKHVGELHDICLVFPNRRAGVFFLSYLQKELSSAVIAPQIKQVNELFHDYSDLHQGDRLQLISILYKIFKKHTGTNESFDEFYFWGEVLLSDFNDIDSYLIDAKDLFTNISDLKEVESLFYYLTPEQKEVITHFWGSLGEIEKRINQKNFVTLWPKLYPVYSDFKNVLADKGLAYSGMIYRDVIEKLTNTDFQFRYKKYYFIGLNALNNCEKDLFLFLKQHNKAEFLWDYHPFYFEDRSNEAGRFIRENLKTFPPPDDFHSDYFTSEGPVAKIKFVSVSSNHGQAQEIPRFFEELKLKQNDDFDNTAIIIADESLLFPALSALPPDIGTVNVTMGYPVNNTIVFGFLLLLINLLKNRKKKDKTRTVVYYRYVTDILNHQLLERFETGEKNIFLNKVRENNILEISLNEIDFSPVHKLIFNAPDKVADYSSYFLDVLAALYDISNDIQPGNKLIGEIIYSLFQAIERLKIMVETVAQEHDSEISEIVYFRLLGQYLGQLSVPFEGEPLEGVQVMGILETRCLDFSNIIILGFNENKWPATFLPPSFIPFSLRKGFNMPGIDEQDAMYAYYFYRLLQRSEKLTATYCNLKEGISTGELSRYGYQLLYDSSLNVSTQNLEYSFSNDPPEPVIIPNSDQFIQKLLNGNSSYKPLSPTALNTFLHCSLQFYFRYILKLPEPDEMKDEIDSLVFGNIFHQTVESLYKPLVGRTVNRYDLYRISKNKELIEREILTAMGKHYFKSSSLGGKPVEPKGKSVLIYENIRTFLKRLLELDMQKTPFKLVSLEKTYITQIEAEAGGRKTNVFIGGKIDRVDMVNGYLRVLDYKTGYVDSLSFKEVAELFVRDSRKPRKEILQALLYSYILKDNLGDDYIYQPVIYSLRRVFGDKFAPEIKLGSEYVDIQLIESEFNEYLKELVSEIFSSETKFHQTSDERYCRYCPYSRICMRY
ncbi:MAG: PD-(D/E)XK nuclease family protein [Prolixibacteraceae bacterium]|nr:PD-(D/E)XK nuclease family protein [Prolixibacteraceae bacterium]